MTYDNFIKELEDFLNSPYEKETDNWIEKTVEEIEAAISNQLSKIPLEEKDVNIISTLVFTRKQLLGEE